MDCYWPRLRRGLKAMHPSICSHIQGCIAHVHTYICRYIRKQAPKKNTYCVLSKIVILDCPTNKILLHIVLYVCVQIYIVLWVCVSWRLE